MASTDELKITIAVPAFEVEINVSLGEWAARTDTGRQVILKQIVCDEAAKRYGARASVELPCDELIRNTRGVFGGPVIKKRQEEE
jgi:hypothetical protein